MSEAPDPRSIPQLLSDLARELTTLFRKEGELIRAELSEKATQLQVGASSALAGALILLVALNVLAAALVVAVSKLGEPDIGGGWAALIVGGVLAVIGAILVKRGTSSMTNLTPERSVHQVSRDAHLVKEQVR